MIWLTWRQLRTQASVVYAGVAVFLLALAVTFGQLPEAGAGFLDAFAAKGGNVQLYTIGFLVVMSLPAIVGVFWGAPMVTRELEMGTHRLVWNQTVTRTRWLATKLGVTGGAAMVAAGLAGLLMTWWSNSLDKAINAGQQGDGILQVARMEPLMFLARGIVPIGYTAFAFVLGVTVGILVRRTVPAMAITLAVFVFVQVAVPTWLRSNLDPATLTTTITDENLRGISANVGPNGPVGPVRDLTVAVDRPGAWLIANQTVKDGKVQDTLPSWVATCIPAPPVPPGGGGEMRAKPIKPVGDAACYKRLADEGYRQRVTYQPADRYWTFQAIETAFFITLAGLLAASSFWWLRHRVV
jgi:hypothetical protein